MEASPDPDRPPGRGPDALGPILADLEHALCAPVAALCGRFQALLVEPGPAPLNDGQRGHLRTMVGLCDDLIGMTRGYLAYTGIVRDAAPPRPAALRLREVVAELDRRSAPQAAERGLAWEAHLDGRDRRITTDAARLHRALGLLVENALTYTPAGGAVRVRVEAAGDHWRATIADTGPGIPEADRDRVFEPFIRLPRDERAGIAGLGLGLAACRILVDRLGGTLALGDNPDGPGTLVTVRLPLDGPPPLPS